MINRATTDRVLLVPRGEAVKPVRWRVRLARQVCFHPFFVIFRWMFCETGLIIYFLEL